MSIKRSQQRIPLYDRLKEHQQHEFFSLHVPGHKNGLNWPKMPFSTEFLSFDQTEVTGLDYLHKPVGVLKESQRLLSQLYDSQESFFLVNGSTVGNISMILAAVAKQEQVFVMKHAHQSIFHGLALAEADPIFLEPEIDRCLNVPAGLSLERLMEAITQYPEAKVLILTYPNYYGQVYELASLIQFAHEKGIMVLVDEAHGAHFIVSDALPPSSVTLGADVVVQSAHKMLPAMTQSAYLHVGKNSLLAPERVARVLQQLQSSSPSYLLMLSLDIARHFAGTFSPSDWTATTVFLNQWKLLFEEAGLTVYQPDDLLKLVLKKEGISGMDLARHLEADGLFVEMSDSQQVVVTLPLLKENQQVALPVLKQTTHLAGQHASGTRTSWLWHSRQLTTLAMSYGQQKMAASAYCALAQALHQVAAENIIVYPPGIPIVVAGEIITAQMIDEIQYYLVEQRQIVGVGENQQVLIYQT